MLLTIYSTQSVFDYILNKKQNGGQPSRIPVVCPFDNIMLFYRPACDV